MAYDEFSGLDQITHVTGALASIRSGIPRPPRQHQAPSLENRRARNNDLNFLSRSTRSPGSLPMPPGRPTAAQPSPQWRNVRPAYGQTGPAPGVAERHNQAAAQYTQAAYDHLHAASVKRAQGLHREAAAHEQAATVSANTAQAHATAGASAAVSQPSKGSAMNQPHMTEVSPDNYFEQPLGFEALAIATTVSTTATSKPQNIFRPTRLLIPSAIVTFFTISNIRIGTDSQLVGTPTMPAQVYSELAVGAAFLLGTANIGIEISLDVKNTDTVTHDFRAVMIGQTFK